MSEVTWMVMGSLSAEGSTARACGLLGAVAEAAGEGTTRVAMARQVALAMRRHLGLGRLELGWCSADGDRAEAVVVDCQSETVKIETLDRDLSGTPARIAIQRRALGVARNDAPSNPGQVWYLPLVHRATAPGYAVLRLRGAVDRIEDAAVMGALARVLQGAQHATRLLRKVARVSKNAHLENRRLRRKFGDVRGGTGFVASDPSMRHIVAQLDLVASYDTAVLLLGESGTGKEVLARRLHNGSRRAAGPFIQVNCGALPEGLIESALFGHEKGAFTGADRVHRGRFERAHRGTLLLDEIGDLPPSAQVKLLRVLQEKQIERVGGEQSMAVDVRVVAATHKPLDQLVEQGHFRADLFYRLSAFPIHIPPLRERSGDIPELVQHLLKTLCVAQRRDVPRVAPDTLECLLAHAWPGNVRELQNVLERALILSPHETIEPDVLPAALRLDPAAREAALVEPEVVTFDQAMRHAIARALRASGGKIYGEGGAAGLLGLKPSTLQSKMKRLGLQRVAFGKEP